MKRNIFFIIITLLCTNILLSQRIKLFQLERKGPNRIGYVGLTNINGDQVYTKLDSLIKKVADSSYTNEIDNWDLGANGSYTTISNTEQVNFVGSGIAATSRTGNVITITATEVDGSTTNEIDTWQLGANASYTTISNGSQVNFVGSGIVSTSRSVNTITISASEVDGSTTNEIDNWDLGANGSYTTISNTEQVNFVGSGIVSTSRSLNTITVTATEVDGSTSNEIDNWDLGANGSYTTISNTEQVNFVGSGIVSTSRTGNTITINASSSGGAMSLSGGLVFTISGTTGSMAYQASSGISIVNTGSSSNSNLVITNTGDLSSSNEIDTWDLGANASYTTISNFEQVNFVGSGIVSTSRTGNTITISASSSGTTDLSFSGGPVPVLNSSSGADVTFTGSGVSFFASGTNMSITATDASTTNEIDTWDLGANGSYTTISNTEQVNFVGSSNGITTSRSGNTIDISNTYNQVIYSSPGSYTIGSTITDVYVNTGSSTVTTLTLPSPVNGKDIYIHTTEFSSTRVLPFMSDPDGVCCFTMHVRCINGVWTNPGYRGV